MVVLAIIAMLAGLILYGVGRTRARAVMVQCQNNLREHGVVLGQLMLEQQASGGASDFGKASFVSGGGGGLIMIYDSQSGETRTVTEAYLRQYGGIRAVVNKAATNLASADALYGNYLDFNIPSNVRHCPALPDYAQLINTNSTMFKGYGYTFSSTAMWGFDGGSVVTTNRFAIDTCIDITTYGLNTMDLSPPSIAYIDWNAAEGWGTWSQDFGYHGYLYHTTWQFNNSAKGIVRGTSKGTTNWWHTEVGFRHLGGANYITWGGQGGWVHSNDINLGYFKK
jgi:hypothetical protein